MKKLQILNFLLLISFFGLLNIANAQTTKKPAAKKVAPNPPKVIFKKAEGPDAASNFKTKPTPPELNPNFLGRFPGSYNIKVKIKGLKNVKIYLADNFGDKQYYRDTCYLDAKGMGAFTGNPKLQRGMYMIVFPEAAGYYELPITDDQDFSFDADTSLDDTKIKILGSLENEAFVGYQKNRRAYGEKRFKLENEYKKVKADNNEDEKKRISTLIDTLEAVDVRYRNSYSKTNPTHLLTKLFTAFKSIGIPAHDKKDSMFEYNYYKNHYWDNIDFSEDGLIRAPQGLLVIKINDYIDKISFQDPDSLVQSVDFIINKTKPYTEINKFFIQYITNKFQDRKIMCQDNVTVHLINKYYCTGRTWWYDDTANLRKMCEESKKAVPTMCGRTAPDIKLMDTAGIYRTLYENLGLYTILFYYDPTCGHCKEVIPVVQVVHQKLKQYGIKVYAVSTENKYDEWRDMMRKKPELNEWVNVCKTNREYNWVMNKLAYNIVSNPTLFVLDKEAKIIGKKIDEYQLEFFLLSLLYEKGIVKEKPNPPLEKKEEKKPVEN